MLPFIKETGLWQYLKQTKKPIYIYGMGDGAIKIMEACEHYQIKLSGIYASDEYVRGHSFCGFKVKRLCEVEAEGEFITLLAFATEREPLLSYLFSLGERLELYAPDVPVFKTDGSFFDVDFLNEHEVELAEVHSLLADEQSRKVFSDILNFKISGKLCYLKSCESDQSEAFDLLTLSPQECYLDLGAYNGDTVLSFIKKYGSAEKIVAFEPDKKNFQKLLLNLENAGITAECHNIGAWNEETELHLNGGKGGRNSHLSESGRVVVPVNSVDNILKGEKATFIKLDVEGAEYETLLGCRETIKRYHPKLLISAYHKNEDLFTLPRAIFEIDKGYKLYLRHHPYIPAWETNFYLTRCE